MKETKVTAKIPYYGEANCELKLDISWRNDKTNRNRGTLHISLPWSPEEIPGSGWTEHPPYGSTKGEDPQVDKLWKRYNRAELALQKQALGLAAQQGWLTVEEVAEAKWSRKAGCSCGCSPGWIFRNAYKLSGWLTIKSPKKEAREKEEQREWEARREQEVPTFSI